ncbi:MAG: peptidoglycan -binding protein [Rhodobacter sp.]|nr:peptidoglycan -binding protein [Rhodobacter sp.]
MALTRRSTRHLTGNIWPGFVDAMTGLLLVLIFVLTIFMFVQFVLRETISGQESEMSQLNTDITQLARALGAEQQLTFRLQEEVGSLTGELEESRAGESAQRTLIASLQLQVAEQRTALDAQTLRIADFEERVATLLIQRDEARDTQAALETDLAATRDRNTELLSQGEALRLALAQARSEIDEQAEAARLAAARREALDALVEDLRGRVREGETSLVRALQGLEGSRKENRTLNENLAMVQAALDQESAANAGALARIAELETELSAAQALAMAEGTALEDLRTGFAALEASLDKESEARKTEAAEALALRERLESAEARIEEEEAARLAEAAAALALRERLADSQAELSAMALALEERRQEAERTLTLLAAARAEKADANRKLSEAASEAKRQAALLETANRRLDEEEALTADSLRKAEALRLRAENLTGEIRRLQGMLDIAEELDTESRARIESLGQQLNAALARVATEQRLRADMEEAERRRLEDEARQLQAYRSEFFGELRKVLENREGVRIEGDRFVFSSEVLFESAEASLAPAGEEQIERVVEILREVAARIPPEIDWVVRVDGHTDDVPFAGGNPVYADNWELSQARALSVVRFMTEELDFPPERLAAAGFGMFHPENPDRTPEARAQNRRIELKLTEK